MLIEKDLQQRYVSRGLLVDSTTELVTSHQVPAFGLSKLYENGAGLAYPSLLSLGDVGP
jgi:hypothetical protein